MKSLLSMLIPFSIGAFGLLQGALNRQVATYVGVTHATLITNLGTVLLCIAFYFTVKAFPMLLPPMFQLRAPLTAYKWWYVFPPLFGFFVISTIPYAIANFGAVKVTVGLIAAQMIVSVLWDLFVEGIGLNSFKLVGITFAILSVIFTSIAKQ